jgi:iron complex outermembrane receptor protein
MDLLHLIRPGLPACLLLSLPLAALAQTSSAPDNTANAPSSSVSETLQVTVTRVPEDVETVPVSITVITGQELADRGITDLSTALANVAGVAIAPGGDAGPRSSVPELWGLREFDAFLLVVDGVPYGGAFNPALSALDLNNVDRIEVLRGSAPVMYGATSFVGVIHVIHRDAGAPGGDARAWFGSYGSYGGAASMPLPAMGSYRQTLTANGEKQGFSQVRDGWNLGHLLYRGRLDTGSGGLFHVDLDGQVLHALPGSPTPLVNGQLAANVPVDSNENPLGSHLNDNRIQLNVGFDQQLGWGTWTTLVSGDHSTRSVGRGFLENTTGDDPDDHGIVQHLQLTDLYLDSHIAREFGRQLQLVAGVDELYGKAHNASADWDFFENVNGSNPPNINQFSPFGATDLHDQRSFAGLYAQSEWRPTSRWHIELGARLNHTHETLETTSVDLTGGATAAAATAKDVSVGPGNDRRTVTRASGAAGVSFMALEGSHDAIWVYTDYRNTFKPAALDFGPDVNGVILNPETAKSYEAGLKGRHLDGGLNWELSLFRLDFSNLVVAQTDPVTGNPELVNAGNERFKGAELEVDYLVIKDVRITGTYSYHDARYTHYLALLDEGQVELAGNQLPMSAHGLSGLGINYAPPHGFTGWALVNFTGRRFYDPENTAVAPSYSTWSGGVGYRVGAWEARVDGWNLNDTRPAISASELGDGQFYRMAGRSFRLTGIAHLR